VHTLDQVTPIRKFVNTSIPRIAPAKRRVSVYFHENADKQSSGVYSHRPITNDLRTTLIYPSDSNSALQMAAEESPDRSVPIGVVLALPSVAALFEKHFDGEQVRQFQQQLQWERQQQAQQAQEAHLPHLDASLSASASASSVSLLASSAHPLTESASLPSAAAASSASASSAAALLAAITIARARTVVRALFNSSLLEMRPADPQTNEELQARVSE
jgi:hypothetical protein